MRFAARGGKMIVVGGRIDSVVPHQSMIDWYERAAVVCGGRANLEKSCRFYLFPAHGHGFLIKDHQLLVRWVENGEAPASLACDVPGGKVPVEPYSGFLFFQTLPLR